METYTSLWHLLGFVFCLMCLFTLLFQMGIKMHKLGERCDLFQEGGQVTDKAIDKRMDFHFNAILDVVSEWRKDKSQSQDKPLRGAEHGCFDLKCDVH